MLYDQRALDNFRIVVEHGGIRNAVDHIPYGMTLSGLSHQMTRLEEEWGCQLFERQPFKLTADGRELYRVACENHRNLFELAAQMRQLGPTVRIAASAQTIEKYLKPITHLLVAEDISLGCVLRAGSERKIVHWLTAGQVDLAFMPEPTLVPDGLTYHPILSASPVLVVPAKSPFQSADEVLIAPRLDERFIAPPKTSPIRRAFAKYLKGRGIRWQPRHWTSCVHMIPWCVEALDRIGLTVDRIAEGCGAGCRVLALPGIEPMTMGALEAGNASPEQALLISAFMRHAHEVWAQAEVES